MSLSDSAFEVKIGHRRLHVVRELDVTGEASLTCRSLLLFDPDRFLFEAGDFSRLPTNGGVEVCFADGDRPQRIQIEHKGDHLDVRSPVPGHLASLSVLSGSGYARRLVARRRQALDRLVEVFGGPIESLTPDEGLAVLRNVNDRMANERHRPRSVDGQPGDVVEIPEHLTPVLIGDLHACVDNLLKILSENATMEELDRGRAGLVFLGDAVHAEDPDRLASMETSVLMMDLIVTLKWRYPDQVFFLLGNHDSFSEEVTKAGVAQGPLWARHVKTVRGDAYHAELERFYRLSPIIARSKEFVACHAGPPLARISRDTLVNARRTPGIAKALTWNRLKAPASPSGYSLPDVRRFRKALGVGVNVPFIVAHSPRSTGGTVWRDIGRIPHHHMVYSARSDRVGVFTRVDGEMVPQVYSAEPLLPWVNRTAVVRDQ